MTEAISTDTDLAALIKKLESADAKAVRLAKEQLAEMPQRSIQPLIMALSKGGSVAFKMRVKDTLVKIGEPAVSALITAMGDSSPHAREYAADALGDIGDPRAYPVLEAAQLDTHPDVAKMAKVALDTLKRKGVRPIKASEPERDDEDEADEPLFASSTNTLAPHSEAPPPPMFRSQPSLHPLNPADVLTVFGWVFLDPKQLATLDEQGKREVRRVMALPIAVMLWIPMLVPLIGLDLGLYYDWLGDSWALLLQVGALVGILAFSLLGWLMPPVELMNTKQHAATWIGIASAIPMFGVSVANAIFLVLVFAEFGSTAGWAATLSMMLAVLITAGIAQAVHLNEVAWPVMVIGGVLAYLIIVLIGMTRVFYILLVVPGFVMIGISRWLMVADKNGGGAIQRGLAFLLLPISNAALIWILLFDGWWILMGRPEIMP